MSRCTALFIAGCLTASAVAAQTRVTLCGSDVQSGAGTNLAQAIRGGGTIVFDCQPGTRIVMTTGHAVPPGTVIDGGDAVALDAEGRAMSMFGVAAGSSLTLQRITIRNARVRRSAAGFPSSVVQASGDLVLDRVTIERSEAPVTVRGAARIAGSRFIANDSWAVTADGTAEIEDSSFIGNATGLSIKSGAVHNCVFDQNREGALRVFYPTAEVRIISSSFSANDGRGAILLSQRSARAAAGMVTIRRCEFTMNRHRFGGGAINVYDTTADAQSASAAVLRTFPPARFLIAYSRFTGNRGRSGGAINADLSNTDGMVVQGGIFIHNEGAENGGAIAWQGRAMRVTNGLFRANRAGSGGSALLAQGQEPGAAWAVANSLIVENVAGAGGSAVDAGAASLVNVTVARNTGFGVAARAGAQPAISNSIISENSEGNCRGVAAGAFRGVNLQFGTIDCPGVTVADPELDTIYIPGPGSPVLNLGDLAVCRAAPVSGMDVVYQSRGLTGVCALGAYERAPLRRFRSRERRTVATDASRVPGHRPAPEPTDASRFVLDALAADEQMPSRRTEVTLSRGDQQSQYMIEKVSPDRLHVVARGAVGEEELFIIDGRVFQKIAGDWKESTALVPNALPPLLGIVENRLENVTEGDGMTENDLAYRTFRASTDWSTSTSATHGTLDFTIAAETHLPRRITFTGECDGIPCSFDQTFDYEAEIVIEPPER